MGSYFALVLSPTFPYDHFWTSRDLLPSTGFHSNAPISWQLEYKLCYPSVPICWPPGSLPGRLVQPPQNAPTEEVPLSFVTRLFFCKASRREAQFFRRKWSFSVSPRGFFDTPLLLHQSRVPAIARVLPVSHLAQSYSPLRKDYLPLLWDNFLSSTLMGFLEARGRRINHILEQTRVAEAPSPCHRS
jgi:hypothetical protein